MRNLKEMKKELEEPLLIKLAVIAVFFYGLWDLANRVAGWLSHGLCGK